MRRLGYISTSVLLSLAALAATFYPVSAQTAGGLRSTQLEDSGDSTSGATLDDDTFAQTLPLEDSLNDPADRFLNRNEDNGGNSGQRRRAGRRTGAANAAANLEETRIPQIPNGIPDRPFDLTNQDPPTTGSVPAQPDAPARAPAAERPDPYAPLGIRSGSFILFPELGISGVNTDNVGQDERGERAATGFVLRPGLAIQSNWARHSYRFAVNSVHTFFPEERGENRNEINGTLDLRLDVSRNAQIEYSGRYTLSQDSSDSDSSGSTSGTSIDHELGGDLTISRRNAKLLPSLRVGVDAFIFGNETLSAGGTQANSDRDYIEPDAELRLTYAHTSAVQPYLAGIYSRRMHKERVDRSGLERDSDGYELKGGVDLALGALVTGNVEIGVGVRDFEDPTLKTTAGLVGTSQVNWNLTPLTTLALSASGSLDETSTAGASAIRRSAVGIALTHRFRRNLTGTAGFNASFSDFVGIRRLDETYEIDLGLAYALSRNIEVTGSYNHTTTKSSVPGQEFSENQFSAGVRFRL